MSLDEQDQELLSEFVVESQEHLSDVENQLLTLESQGDHVDVALVNTVFRAVHSIKGAAGFLGLDVLQALAHREEEILNKLRNHELRPTSVVIDTLLKATDRLKGLLDNLETSNDQDVSDHLAALEAILSGEQPVATADATTLKTPDVESPVSALSSEALREFLVESYENLEQLERDLLALEDAQQSESLINSIFRSIHTIKGTSGFLGFRRLEQLTHVTENLLGDVRAGQIKMSGEIPSAVLTSVDKVRELLQSIEQTGAEVDCGSESLAEALTRLHEIMTPSSPTKTEKKPARKQAQRRQTKAPVKSRSAGSVEAGEPAAEGETRRRSRSTGSKPSQSKSKNAASRNSKNTSAIKADADVQPRQSVELSDASQQTAGDTGGSSKPQVVTAELSESRSGAAQSISDSRLQSEANASKTPAIVSGTTSRASNAAKPAASGGEISVADSSIRVDVSLLDRLMTCVGELVLARNQILQFTNSHSDSELLRTSQRLNLITTELQEGVMKTRMQPIGNVWAKFPRLVRDLAAICEKQVRIEMEGKETELDKTIIEAIKDPLTHLVRNTVDHGIERPEVRQERGKPTEGCLTLRAYHEGGQVNIEICDDGAGLNLERIKAKAIERGLLTSEQASRLHDRDVGKLIFLPGFSTAGKVSNVSGRGVGMDVVKTNIEKIGGTVDLQTVAGYGTTIKIKIPLTLAIIPALIVTCAEDRYAIPQVNLLELVRLGADDAQGAIEFIQGVPVYRLRGRLLPLVYLRKELGIASVEADSDQAVNIVVLRVDDRQFGLVVDRINDTEEIVVKPLSSQIKHVPIHSGTTIMGDGAVALILDVIGLAHAAKVTSATNERQASENLDRHLSKNENTQTLLIVGLGQSARYAVPLAQVTRLEKISPTDIEMADQQEVCQYRGEIMPLIRIGNVLGVYSHSDTPEQPLDVVVYTEQDQSIGLVVDRVIDIVDARLEITRPSHRDELMASVVVQDHVTDLLDLPTVIRSACPSGFSLVSG